eukprot:SAG11_NODE_24250_length_376_cov_0.736462_1_plen_72_part_01
MRARVTRTHAESLALTRCWQENILRPVVGSKEIVLFPPSDVKLLSYEPKVRALRCCNISFSRFHTAQLAPLH